MKLRNKVKKEADGFITIEYTLLIPVLLVLYTFLVCIGLYQYNQCILRTNIYILGTEGSQLMNEEASSRVAMIQEMEELLYYDKYLLAEELQTAYSVSGNHIEICGSGKMTNPFAVWGLGETSWELKASCKLELISSARTLQLCKAIRNTLQGTLSEEVSDGS